MEIIGKILGSPARVKIMRLFLLNPGKVFTIQDVSKRSRVSKEMVRKELKLLASVDFAKKRVKNWIFNPIFKYTAEFESLFLNSDTLNKNTLINKLKRAGKLKLLVIAGVFIKNKDSRVDLLVVGDKMRRPKVEEELRKIEADLGVELTYAIFETKEFVYRLNMYDKLIWDVLDFPHEVVLQAKELSTQVLKKA